MHIDAEATTPRIAFSGALPISMHTTNHDTYQVYTKYSCITRMPINYIALHIICAFISLVYNFPNSSHYNVSSRCYN